MAEVDLGLLLLNYFAEPVLCCLSQARYFEQPAYKDPVRTILGVERMFGAVALLDRGRPLAKFCVICRKAGPRFAQVACDVWSGHCRPVAALYIHVFRWCLRPCPLAHH